jgi:hypothetical protein
MTSIPSKEFSNVFFEFLKWIGFVKIRY